MSEIRITSDQLGDRLQGEVVKVQQAQMAACLEAALHLVAHLKALSDELGITYQGIWKNSNQAEQTEDGAVTFNDSPHAGIVEEGCRPHHIPKEIVETVLVDWVVRKLGVDVDEAHSVAWAVANKIAAEGVDGRFPYAMSLDKAREFYHQAIERRLHS